MKKYIQSVAVLAIGAVLSSCGAGGDNQGLEYAPNMYHSVPYEALSQVTDPGAGEATQFMSDTEDGHGEYYNSNPHNPNRMTMRVPPVNAVPRSQKGYLPYTLHKDSLELAARTLKSPLTASDEAILKDGKVLYERFCEHCHGSKGQADGLVAEKYPGVANLSGLAYQNITEGHIFHVITHGKGLMGAHGSQISPEERWEIAKYVKKLQNQ
ncbi:cytochrome c [Fulvivirga sp. M361]|uniref:c-type cytochrome n=1 Tax=Fulvivirga sp. M361 TaxID=2594266 RepID=UPI001179A768|nr:cytochrome c [Fulvivirga sp. M361]TRX61729.1 cytochrome c [Fulvivirga sp. M361]